MAKKQGVDLIIDSEGIEQLISNVTGLKADLEKIYRDITDLQEEIAVSNEWLGNGKDEEAAFLNLISQYAAHLCGAKYIKCNFWGTKTVLDSKNVSGTGEDHMSQLLLILSEYNDKFSTFEKNAIDKAECIVELDSIQ